MGGYNPDFGMSTVIIVFRVCTWSGCPFTTRFKQTMGDGSSPGSMFKEVKEAAIVLGVLIGFAIVVGFLSLIDYQRKSNTSYDYAASILLQQASTQQCDAFLYNLTRTPTVAGENLETAKWIQSQMIKFGLTDSRIDQYDVMLSTPTNLNQIQLLDVDNNVERDLDLYEKPIDEDPTSKIAKEKIPTYVCSLTLFLTF
jgi:hypothetical protein